MINIMSYNFIVTIARIVGNELPPRHMPGSHIEQLRFILRNEPNHAQVKKIWVLNRIIDNNLALTLTEELQKNNCSFYVIPFDISSYKQYVSNLPHRNIYFFRNKSDIITMRKAGFIIAINRARNHAIELAKGHAHWTIALDGGCCFNNKSFAAMLEKANAPKQAFYAIPTFRMTDNNQWESFDSIQHPMHESMLMLPGDMINPFDENRIYGNSDKLATIRKLFPRSALKQTSHATIVSDPQYYAGYVLRLPSGNAMAEGKYKNRIKLRNEGLIQLVEKVEAMLIV